MYLNLGSDLNSCSGAHIIEKAKRMNLNPSLLYEAVIDMSSEGLITANCINLAAGILLDELGFPNYFFETISKESLKSILASIAKGIHFKGNKVVLHSWVADIDFDLTQGSHVQRIRIATAETLDKTERSLDRILAGHRREYYYNPENEYYTYVFRPETVADYPDKDFIESPFLFNRHKDYNAIPKLTRNRYEKFLERMGKNVAPFIEVFNLSDIGETRFMFNSDFELPQLPVSRKIFSDRGLTITRAYWEPYFTEKRVPTSICSLYIRGEVSREQEAILINDLQDFLSFHVSNITRLYTDGLLTFKEMLFAGNAVDFTHLFIFKEQGTLTDRKIMESLNLEDHRESFSQRIHESNKFTYVYEMILNTVMANPDLIRFLYDLFDSKFNPAGTRELTPKQFNKKAEIFGQMISVRFMDDPMSYDVFKFMLKLISSCLKTNFYKPAKRSFSFRLDNQILDPMVFKQFVYGLFFVNGHYACGTHMRADDIARGGLRMLRVTHANYDLELDNAVLLNYALGPKAQRLKHKDICESGSKGVVIPHPRYAQYSREALFDYTEGIMDLMLIDNYIKDYYGYPEMVFFGPDEGTAKLMDDVAFRAKERGYVHWRTITTGKSFGIPHDTYGILKNNDLFGLVSSGKEGMDLLINGKSVIKTTDMDKIYERVGDNIDLSGMTTTSVMGVFRTLIAYGNNQEEDINLMMTGGPDGDLGANQIQCYKGKICLILDSGSILFDPDGLDKKALMKIAFMRHTNPRANSLAYPEEKLGTKGFRVKVKDKNITLPDGSFVLDGAMFHRNFLTDPANRKFVEQANIRAFIPCGGFRDTINQSNVKSFTELFRELCFIVEGANVFFNNAARRFIAQNTGVLQIKDSSANKGGVFSSSVAEVLTAFLLEDEYEKRLLDDIDTRWALIRNIMKLVYTNACKETEMLISLNAKNKDIPLFVLSEQSSEQIFAFQAQVAGQIDKIAENQELLWQVLTSYIPDVLVTISGKESILRIMNEEKLIAYRNAIVSKKIASTAFYRYGADWKECMASAEKDFSRFTEKLFETN